MSGFDFSDAATQRMRSSPLRTGRPLTDEVSRHGRGVSSSASRLPRYAFDPSVVMDHSIKEQLQRLYDAPEFDANPVHHYRTELPATYYVSRRARPAPLRPASAAVSPPVPFDTYGVRPPTLVIPRRPVSSFAFHHSPHAPYITTDTAPTSQVSGGWSRQRRKEELIENGLEPMQNLVGLDNYFVERPHFSYHPIAPSAGATGASTTLLERVAGVSRGGARRVSPGQVQTSAGVLPSTASQSATQVFIDQRPYGSRVHHPAPAVDVKASATPTERASPPPRAAAAVPRARQHTTEGNAGNAVKPLPASPDTTSASFTQSNSGSGSSVSTSASSSSGDVFFDEDPLSLRRTGPEPPTSSAASSHPVPRPSPPAPPTDRGAHALLREEGASTVAAFPSKAPEPRPPSSSGCRGGTAAAATPSPPLASPGGDIVARGTPGSVEAPSLDGRRPHAPPTIAVDLSRLARSPSQRRCSIDTLLTTLLRLRLQHQRVSHTPNAAAAGAVNAAPSPSRLPGGGRRGQGADRRGGSRIPVRPASSPQSRQPASSHGRRGGRLNTSYESRPNSVYITEKGTSAENNPHHEAEDVYVRLYHRHRRCECCEVPLPTEVVHLRPTPPHSHRVSGDGLPPHRRARRLPDALRRDVAANSPPEAVSCTEVSQTSSAPLRDGPPLPFSSPASRFALYSEVDCSEEPDAGHRGASPALNPRSLLEAELEQPPSPRTDRVMELLEALVHAVRPPADHRVGSAVPATDEDYGSSGASQLEEAAQRLKRSGAVSDEALRSEVLRAVLGDTERTPPHPAYAPARPLHGPRVPGTGLSAFPRASPYAVSELLYPYNLPRPLPRDDLVETAPGTTSVEEASAATAAPPGECLAAESDVAVSSPSDAAQNETVAAADATTEVLAAAAQTATATATVTAREQAASPVTLLPSPPTRAVEDKSVQTSLSSSRRHSAANKSEAEGRAKGERRRSSSSSCGSVLANTVASLAATPTKGLASVSTKTLDSVRVERLVAATPVSHASPSPLAPSSVPAASPSPFQTSPNRAVRHEMASGGSSKTVTVADVKTVIQRTVFEAQGKLLADLEATLRARLAKDELVTRHKLAIEELMKAEAAARCGVGAGEVKERAHLQRSGRYGRDRMLVMEASLTEWGRALEEEGRAWLALRSDAAAEARALQARAEAAARLRESLADLLYEEARIRQSIRFTEALVSRELQLSICDYVEVYDRDDLEYTELIAWLELERACLDSVVAAAHASSSSVSESTANSTLPSDIKASLSKGASELACAEEAEEEVDFGNGGKEVAELDAQHAGIPFLTPALLLGNEEAKAEAHGVNTAAGNPARMGEPSLSTAPSAPRSPPEVNAASSASEMSGGVVFEAATKTATPEELDANDGASHTPSASPPAILILTPSLVIEPTHSHVEEPAAPIPDSQIAIEVVQENILVATVPMALADVREPLLVSEMLASFPETPQREQPATDPVGDDEKTAAAAVAFTAVAPSMTTNTERQRFVTLPVIVDDAVEGRRKSVFQSGVCSSRFESDSSRVTAVEGHAGEAAAHPHQQLSERESEMVESADAAAASEAADTAAVEDENSSSPNNARSHLAQPLESSMPVEEIPTERNVSLLDHADGGTDTASGRGSSDFASTHRKRRQRHTVRHRTAVADAVEVEEAGEIRSSKDWSRSPTPSPPEMSAWRFSTKTSNGADTKPLHAATDTQEKARDEEHTPEHTVVAASAMIVVGEDKEAEAAQLAMQQQGAAGGSADTCGAAATHDFAVEGEAAGTALSHAEVDLRDLLEADKPEEEEEVRLTVARNSSSGSGGCGTLSKDNNASAAAIAALQAEHIHFESSTDDRRFLSPPSNGGEVDTPHVSSQEDFPGCGTPSDERRRESAVLHYYNGGGGLGKELVKLPASMSQVPHPPPSMPSLSASSLSSPHLEDSDTDNATRRDGEDAEEEEGEEHKGAGMLSDDSGKEHEVSLSNA